MQMIIDVNRSLEGCPPIELDEERGLEWKERKLINRSKVVYHDAHSVYAQVRPDGSKWEDIKLIADGFKVYGFLYDQPPPQVIEDPDRPGWYIGIAGWTKDDALDTLQVSTFIYDVYKINSDLNIRRQKLRANIVKVHRRGNTEVSITAEITQAIEEGELDRNDSEALWKFIQDVASDKTDAIKDNIYNNVRKEAGVLDPRIWIFHAGKGKRSIQAQAEKFGFPHEGTKDPTESGKLGYANVKGDAPGIFMNAIKTFVDHNIDPLNVDQTVDPESWIPIEMTGFAGKLKDGSIDPVRIDWEKANRKIKDETLTDFCWLMAGGKVSKEEIRKNINLFAIKSCDGYNFIPQKRKKYAKKGGNPQETTMVNVKGEPRPSA